MKDDKWSVRAGGLTEDMDGPYQEVLVGQKETSEPIAGGHEMMGDQKITSVQASVRVPMEQ